MEIFVMLISLALDFLFTSFVFWLITLALAIFGVQIVFTWGLALAFWVIIKCIRFLIG